MKVTALIPDKLVKQVKHYSQAETITEGLVIALGEWVALRRVRQLNKTVEAAPLEFQKEMSASKIRGLSRRRS